MTGGIPMTEDSQVGQRRQEDQRDESGPAATFLIGELGQRRIFRNAFALAIGRNLNSLARLVIASMVVRGLGAETFGIYSVIVALLAIADWILDFGTTDVFVRELVKNPERYQRLRKSLIAFKLVQTPVSIVLMILALVSLNFSADLIRAGVVACLSLTFFWGVAVYRSIFKATLTMEREMVAEFFSVVVMIPLILIAIRFDLGISGLMWSLVLSRAVFLSGCAILANGERSLSIDGVDREDIVWLARSSLVIGVIGLLIVINLSVEMILLSRLSDLSDVAYYSAAQKLVWPVFMVLGALGVSYYPVLAAQYPRSGEQFGQTCQQLLNLTVLAGGAAICGIYCGAEFLLSILGAELVPAAAALRILAVAFVVKAVAGVIGPVLFIVHAQNRAIRYYSVALIIKTTAIYLLAPTYGFVGTAYISLVTEALFITPLTLFYVWRLTRFRPKLTTAGPVVVMTVASIGLAGLVLEQGTFLCAVAAVVAYCALLLIFRVVTFDSIRLLMRKRSG